MLSTIPFFYRDSWIQPLSDGHAGTLETLAIMRWLCCRDYRSPFVDHAVSEILRSDLQSNWSRTFPVYGAPLALCPVGPLFLFARDQIRFIEDLGPNGEEDIERLADFERTTGFGYGDCDDKCIWLATALLNRNIPTRFRVQSYTGRTWDHVYLEYWDSDSFQWIPLDPTADGHTGIVAEIGWRQPLGPDGLEMIYSI